jgi:hypothetical protein
MLVTAIVRQHNSGMLHRQFDRNGLFQRWRLNESVQQLTTLVSILV